MGQRPNCRSCTHCTPPQGADLGWCQLRRLPIHPELAAELCCHHWTARAPRLPSIDGQVLPLPLPANRQLTFLDDLVAVS